MGGLILWAFKTREAKLNDEALQGFITLPDRFFCVLTSLVRLGKVAVKKKRFTVYTDSQESEPLGLWE